MWWKMGHINDNVKENEIVFLFNKNYFYRMDEVIFVMNKLIVI